MLIMRSSRRAVSLGRALLAPSRSFSAATLAGARPRVALATQLLPLTLQSRFSSSVPPRNHEEEDPNAELKHLEDKQLDARVEEMERRLLERGTAMGGDVVYEGPMARAVRLMKGVSVTSCLLTSMGMPVLCLVSEQDASMVGKWAMCGTIMAFGLGTTSLFHYLFKPYVIRMWAAETSASGGAPAPTASGAVDADDMTLTVETVTLFALLKQHSFRLSEVSPPEKSMHPMLSFQARGRNFFIHPECFEDKELLAKLVGPQAAAASQPTSQDDHKTD